MDQLVLHLIATIRYRFDHSISEIRDGYPQFSIGKGVRTPIEILHHMRGLIYYAEKIITGTQTEMGEMYNWDKEKKLFYQALDNLPDVLIKHEITDNQYQRIVQGPLTDAISHIGQLAMLSRLSGRPVPKQNYSKADI